MISHIEEEVAVTNIFPTPPIKTKTATEVGGETMNKSNPLGPIKLSTQSETWSSQ
jgi:hypothetical protein